VAVGILGLLPATLKLREASSTETRAVMVAQELMSSVRAATSVGEVVIRDGPAGEERNNQTVDLRGGQVVLVGYPAQTSVPLFLWGGERNVGDPQQTWESGQIPPEAQDNAIAMIALLSANSVPGQPDLYQVNVKVRGASGLSLERDAPVEFSTLVYSPLP
jgi:hypothetical protein